MILLNPFPAPHVEAWPTAVAALRLAALAVTALACGCALWTPSPPETAPRDVRVVGYMPAWKGLRATVDGTDLSRLTHINVAFLNPDAEGRLTDGGEPVCMRQARAEDLRYLVERAHAAGVRVLVSLGGGVIPPCAGDWQALLAPLRRPQLVADLTRFVDDFDLDGVDVDLEGVLLTAVDEDGRYTPFLRELAASLKPAGKLLTCATASYEGGMIPVDAIELFDFVNIMSYDAIGPSWGRAGAEHASFEQAERNVEVWEQRGLPREKLVLGVPFYGYGFGADYRSSYSYADILQAFGAEAAAADLIGTACAGCSYVTYNGAATIRRKTQLALHRGSGVMIWELSQDAPGAHSLLRVIDDEIRR